MADDPNEERRPAGERAEEATDADTTAGTTAGTAAGTGARADGRTEEEPSDRPAKAAGWPGAGGGGAEPAVSEVVESFDRRQRLGWLAGGGGGPGGPGGPGGGDGDQLRVQLLTDPWSVWCWGFEPVRRTLELRYPSIGFGALVGGMFPELPDPEEVGFDVHRFFASVQAQTGMPVGTRAVDEDPADSTYPACIHVHAVRLVDPALEGPYLRALREAVYLDGRNVSRPEVARDVAARVGVEPDAFDEMLEMGDAEREFEQRLEILHQYDLHAYPTLLFSHRGKTAVVQGFQNLPNVLTIAEAVGDRPHPAQPAPDLLDVVPEGQRVATREVATVLNVSVEEASDRLAGSEQVGVLARDRHPGGDVWYRAVDDPGVRRRGGPGGGDGGDGGVGADGPASGIGP